MINNIDRLINVAQVAAMLSIGVSTIWLRVKRGEFPKPIKLGPKTTRWRMSDISALMK